MGNLTVDGIKPSFDTKDKFVLSARSSRNDSSNLFDDTDVLNADNSHVSIWLDKTVSLQKKNSMANVYLLIDSMVKHDEKESKKSWFCKLSNLAKLLCFSGKESDNNRVDSTKSDDKNTQLHLMLKELKKQALADLAKQGVDFDDLSLDHRISYLTALANYKLNNIDNSSFLNSITEIHKERVKNTLTSNLPAGLKRFSDFLKDKFSIFFDKTGKIDSAALNTAMSNVSKNVAEKLLLLYSSTIEERRGEILQSAFKLLPKEFDKDSILKFAITSERMSDVQFKFAKTLIEKSDLPNDVKQKYLKSLIENQNKKTDNSIKWVNEFYESSRNSAYNFHRSQIDANNVKYEKICAEQKNINKKLEKFKRIEKDILSEQHQNNLKLKKIRNDILNSFCSGKKFSLAYSFEFNQIKEKNKLLKNNLSNIRSDISNAELQWGQAHCQRRDVVFDSVEHTNGMVAASKADEKINTSLLSKCVGFIKAIFS